MLDITKYAQRLIDDLDDVDLHRARQDPAAQLDRPLHRRRGQLQDDRGRYASPSSLPGRDTLFGATYMVLSPEHPLCQEVATGKLDELRTRSTPMWKPPARKSDFERSELATRRRPACSSRASGPSTRSTGRRSPSSSPTTSSSTYGTGAIMAVPAHDDRDWAFAKKFGCEIVEVVAGGDVEKEAFTLKDDTGDHGQLRLPERPDRPARRSPRSSPSGWQEQGIGHAEGQLQAP